MSRPRGPLRICVASSGLGHVSRGVEAWAQDLAAELARRSQPVVLCKGAGRAEAQHERVVPCFPRESPQARALLDRVPRVVAWRFGLTSAYGIEQLTFALRLPKILRRDRIDILHVQDPLVALMMQRARGWGLVRARTILAHGTEEPVSFLKRIRYLQHLAPSHLEEARHVGAWREGWTVIPNFVDTDRFRPGRSDALRRELGIPPHAFVVLSAAAVKRHHKRVDHLLSEVARLRAAAPDLPVWLVVAGGWEQETDDVVREGTQVLGDRVRFLVRFDRDRMPDLYRAADVFALGSLKEMMPIALLEAAASGLPCLVHPHPVMQWVAGPGGEVTDMTASGELAARLAQLAGRPDHRRDLGERARAHCEATFARHRVVDQILRYYSAVAGDSHRLDSTVTPETP